MNLRRWISLEVKREDEFEKMNEQAKKKQLVENYFEHRPKRGQKKQLDENYFLNIGQNR